MWGIARCSLTSVGASTSNDSIIPLVRAFRVPPEPAQDKSLVCIAGETRKYRSYLTKNSGSEEEFMLDIEVAVAKKQSNDISRKAKMGMLEKAEQGLYPSVTPIGYKNNRLTYLID
jgi:hypothetical protein